MKKYSERSFEVALADIELWNKKEQAFSHSIYDLNIDNDDALRNAIILIHRSINKRQLEAYRNLFMWGIILDNNERLKAKELVLNRFLHEQSHIMPYLSGKELSSWSSVEEKKFREEIAEIKKELENKLKNKCGKNIPIRKTKNK